MRNLPGDDDDLALHRHGLDGRGEHLVGLVGEDSEVLHLVGLGHSRAGSVLGADGDGGVHLALRGVDDGRDLVLVHGAGLEDRVADGEAALGGGGGACQGRGVLARSQARKARSVAGRKHDVSRGRGEFR